MDKLIFQPGTLFYLYGMPVRCVGTVLVEGSKENFRTERMFPEGHPDQQYLITGPQGEFLRSEVYLDLQDEGRTLKLFVSQPEPPPKDC